MEGNMIKEQLEQILKDTKVLCNLKPFVEKWSLNKMLPNLEITHPIKLGGDFSVAEFQREMENQAYSPSIKCDSQAVIFRKLKEVLQSPVEGTESSNDDSSFSLRLMESAGSSAPLEDQYDRELEKTLKALEEIDCNDQAAVTQADIEDFTRGLCKPDGVDLHKTSIQEWKNIFLEHWLDLNGPEKILQRQRQTLPNIIKRKCCDERDSEKSFAGNRMLKKAGCSSSMADEDKFPWPRKDLKNMVTSVSSLGLQDRRSLYERKSDKISLYSNASLAGASNRVKVSRPNTPFLLPKEKSLLTCGNTGRVTSIAHAREKRACSALIGGLVDSQYKKLPINDLKGCVDKFYGDINKGTKTNGYKKSSSNDPELRKLKKELKGNRNICQTYCGTDKIGSKLPNRATTAPPMLAGYKK